ncbi:unnamed protein product, partial [Allacma fusca]
LVNHERQNEYKTKSNSEVALRSFSNPTRVLPANSQPEPARP